MQHLEVLIITSAIKLKKKYLQSLRTIKFENYIHDK